MRTDAFLMGCLILLPLGCGPDPAASSHDAVVLPGIPVGELPSDAAIEPPAPPSPGTEGESPPEPPAAERWWRPFGPTSWQIQLSGTVDESFDVSVYFVDLFDVPKATIDRLRARGRRVVCYFSAGSHEDWRIDAAAFPPAALGSPLDGWPGERWVDVRHPGVLEAAVNRMNLAVEKGCDGVDPDNVDGYTNETGFPLTFEDQVRFNRALALNAHARGLAIGLKNDLEQIPALIDDFDWVLNEQCFEYDECSALLPFVELGKPAFTIEYTTSNRAATCAEANRLKLETLFKPLELTATRYACR